MVHSQLSQQSQFMSGGSEMSQNSITRNNPLSILSSLNASNSMLHHGSNSLGYVPSSQFPFDAFQPSSQSFNSALLSNMAGAPSSLMQGECDSSSGADKRDMNQIISASSTIPLDDNQQQLAKLLSKSTSNVKQSLLEKLQNERKNH